MNNFISLLDTTLKMNKEDDDKSEEDDEVKEVKSHRRVSQPIKPSDADIHRSASLPSKCEGVSCCLVSILSKL